MVLTEKLRLLRVINNRSQTDLAACIHTTQTAYGKLETGKTALKAHHCQKLAPEYKVCEKWLLTDEPFKLLIQVDAKNTIIEIDPLPAAAQPANDVAKQLNNITKLLLQLVKKTAAKKPQKVKRPAKARKGKKRKKKRSA